MCGFRFYNPSTLSDRTLFLDTESVIVTNKVPILTGKKAMA